MPTNVRLPRDVTALKILHAEINCGRLKVYRNLMREPYVYCDHASFPGLHVHLFDTTFRAWITHFIFQREELLLKNREVDRILEELAGRSLAQPVGRVAEEALLAVIESDPVIAVILEFMHERPTYEATMDTLWRELSKFATQRGMLDRGKRRFPGGPNVLSRKLSPLLPLLEQIGIRIEIRRSNGARVTVTRLDDSNRKPSAESSECKVQPLGELLPADGMAERINKLEKRKADNERNTKMYPGEENGSA